MWVRVGIVVDVGHDLARSCLQTGVAGAAQALILGADHPEAILTCNGRRFIARTIVDDDHFEVWVLQIQQTFTAVSDGAAPIVSANNHRYTRPRQIRRERHFGESLSDGS